MSRGYALVNKETLKLLHEKTKVSFKYLRKITGKDEVTVLSWEDVSSHALPTINQAKALAKAYNIPFASLYMKPEDINIAVLPNLENMRTFYNAQIQDDSALNVALIDILNIRQLLLEITEATEGYVPKFSTTITGNTAKLWAEKIRTLLDIDLSFQYQCPSARKFYLYLKKQLESQGIFIQCFENVPLETARGVAVYFDVLPVIGINADDRHPAKSFSIIHELVHIIKRAPSMCNDMYNSFTKSSEEIFCNAVAGEVLVPEEALKIIMREYRNFGLTVEIIERVAKRFCVSKEVIIRRLLDASPSYISKTEYQTFADEFRIRVEKEKEEAKQARIEGCAPRVFSYPNREAVDKTSHSLSFSFLQGYTEGMFDKQDISRYLGIAQRHVDKYLQEVAAWSR